MLQLPTDSQTQGPQQTQNSMTSDTRVASERTLLQNANRIQYGNLLTLPIADGGILYVEPLYTERNSQAGNNSTFPQLSRVLVSYREPGPQGGVKVGYAPTLAEALEQVFGSGVGSAATAPGGDATTALQTEDVAPSTVPGQDQTQAAGIVPPPAPAPSSPTRDAAVAELDAALANVYSAQQSGDLGQLGSAFDRLQRAVDAYQAAGG